MGTESASGQVVVGVDGSAGSAEALRWAARYAAWTHAGMDAVIAWHRPVTYGQAYETEAWRPDIDAEKALTAQIDEVFGAHRPADTRLIVREGSPAHVLIEASKGAALLVVGSRGHGGFYGLLLGSVSANCAERAKCPVVVVHPGTSAGLQP